MLKKHGSRLRAFELDGMYWLGGFESQAGARFKETIVNYLPTIAPNIESLKLIPYSGNFAWVFIVERFSSKCFRDLKKIENLRSLCLLMKRGDLYISHPVYSFIKKKLVLVTQIGHSLQMHKFFIRDARKANFEIPSGRRLSCDCSQRFSEIWTGVNSMIELWKSMKVERTSYLLRYITEGIQLFAITFHWNYYIINIRL